MSIDHLQIEDIASLHPEQRATGFQGFDFLVEEVFLPIDELETLFQAELSPPQGFEFLFRPAVPA
jgi:hypothetical protein